MFEQDYVMRMVKELARALAKILFNKETTTLIEDSQNKVQNNSRDMDIFLLAKNGEINKAENMLYDIIENDYENGLEMGIAFYSFINEFDNDFLEANQYSRDEVKLGFERIIKLTGLDGITSLMI